MATKIRIGNDIPIRWTVTRCGEPEDFTGRTLRLLMRTAYSETEVADFSVDGNVISWTFRGSEQKATGSYTFTLIENAGRDDMNTVDACDALKLVPCTCAEGCEKAVEVASDIAVGVCGSNPKKKGAARVITGRAVPLMPMEGDVYLTDKIRVTRHAVSVLGSVDISVFGGPRYAVNCNQRMSVEVPAVVDEAFFASNNVDAVLVSINGHANNEAYFFRIGYYRLAGRRHIAPEDLTGAPEYYEFMDLPTTSPYVRLRNGIRYVPHMILRPIYRVGRPFRLTAYFSLNGDKDVANAYRVYYNRGGRSVRCFEPVVGHKIFYKVKSGMAKMTYRQNGNGYTYLRGLYSKGRKRRVHILIYKKYRGVWYPYLETEFKGGNVLIK